MQHIDPDELALLALEESSATKADFAHLEQCEECAELLRELGLVSAVGRSAVDVGQLVAPGAHVWSSIASSVARARRRFRVRVALVTGGAVVGALAVTFFVVGAWQPPVTELATADLQAFPDWQGADGAATVERSADGARDLRVSLAVAAPSGSSHEVWLISTDQLELVSLGELSTGSDTFAIPADVDLERFSLVDVSDEPNDGNAAHSGNSIARGSLESFTG